jgi:hypothetical protein
MIPARNDVRLPLSQFRAVAARYVLGSADGMALVQAADALLDAGSYYWAIGELATTPQPTLRDIGPLFESALKELAIPLPPPKEAVRILVRWHLYGVIEGRASSTDALGSLWRELFDQLILDRHLKNLEPERDLLYFWYQYDDGLGLVEAGYVSREEAEHQEADLDLQFLERARSWMYQNGPSLLDPCWLSWNDGIVRKLAQAIADERAWDRLPILADALEEAGCDNSELLEHCRAGEKHVGCCWVTEILLAQETARSH